MRFFLFIVLLSGSVFAQTSDSIFLSVFSKAKFFGDQSKSLEQSGKYVQQKVAADSAYRYAKEAVDIFERLPSPSIDTLHYEQLLQSYNVIVKYYTFRREFEKAEIWLNIALDKIQSSFHHPEKWMHMYYLIKGEFMDRIHRPKSSIQAFEEALNFMKDNPAVNPSSIAYYHSFIGYLYWKTKDWDNAIAFHEEALRLRKNIYGKSHPFVAYDLHQLAKSYDNARRNEGARRNFHGSRAMRIALMGKKDFYLGDLYNDMGVHFWRNEVLDSAIYYLDLAMDIFASFTPVPAQKIGMVLNNKALVLMRQKEYEKAYQFFELSAEKKTSPDFSDPLSLLSTHFNLAYASFMKNDMERALPHVYKGLGTLISNFDPERIPDSMEIINAGEESGDILKFLRIWAIILSSLNDPGIEELQKAEKIFEQMLPCIQQQSQSYRFSGTRIYHQAEANDVYFAFLNDLQLLYEKTGDEYYAKRSYEVYEKARAFFLRKIIQEDNLLRTSGVPNHLIEEVEKLQDDLMFYEQENKSNAVQKVVSRQQAINSRIFTLNQRYDSLMSLIEEKFPLFRKLKKEEPIVSLSQIQKSLDENEAIISYWDSKLKPQTFHILLVYKSGIKKYQIQLNEDFWSRLNSFKKNLRILDMSLEKYQEFCTESHYLYEFLMAPIQKDFSSLGISPGQFTIIPEGKLNNFPFEVLLSSLPATLETNYRNLPYLMRDYSINYAQSASLWYDQMQKENESWTAYAGFGPTYNYDAIASSSTIEDDHIFRSNPIPLKATAKEVRFGQDLFGGKLFLSEDATEENFKEKLGSPAILHLAMHGLVNQDEPMQSKLLFTTASASEDDHLHAYEIYSLRLKTQLAILSACETSVGRNTNGEGVYNLARAFTFSGCPSLLSSLWQANDKYTAQLIQLFLENLHAEEEKHLALRNAKLRYLETTDQMGTHPANWATFIHFGNDKAIKLPSPYTWWLLIIAGILGLAYVSYRIRKSSHSKH